MNHADDYRIFFPDKKIYITRNHDWAFAAWELEKLKGNLKENSTLIHVDGHLDDVPDGTQVEGLLNIKTDKDIYDVTSNENLKIDNFIWAGIATNTLQHVMYISHQTYCSEDINCHLKLKDYGEGLNILKSTIEKKDCSSLRFRYVEDFKSFIELNVLEDRFFKGRDIILDLDLDYFVLNTVPDKPTMMSESEIYRNLCDLKELYDWSLITVALSPLYCGGEEECNVIFDLFLEVFELDIEKSKYW